MNHALKDQFANSLFERLDSKDELIRKLNYSLKIYKVLSTLSIMISSIVIALCLIVGSGPNAAKLLDVREVKPDSTRINVNDITSRIQGGTLEAPILRATWTVALNILNGGINPFSVCTGTLLRADVILTAGHCIQSSYASGWSVFANFDGQVSFRDGESRKVTSWEVPIKFTDDLLKDWDIGLVFVEPFNLGDQINVINLPTLTQSKMENKMWKDCHLAGVGYVVNPDGQTCNMQNVKKFYMTGRLVNLDCCYDRYEEINGPSEHYPKNTKCFRSLTSAPCSGDSGGGIVCKSKLDPLHMVLVGMVRAGPLCCDKDRQKWNEVIEKNVVVLDWIKTTIDKHDSKNTY